MIVTVHEAKTQLSKLIRAVEAGEEVVIARGNTPVVRLEPVLKPAKRQLGALAHLTFNIEGFDDPALNQQIEQDFYDAVADKEDRP